MNPAAIVSALRTRATNEGHNVVLFRTIDPEVDTLPALLFATLEEGRERDPEVHGLVHRLLDITVMVVARVDDDDHLIDALQLAEEVTGDLVTVEADVPDRLDTANVNSLEVIETRAEPRTSSTDVFVVEILLRAHYIGASQ